MIELNAYYITASFFASIYLFLYIYGESSFLDRILTPPTTIIGKIFIIFSILFAIISPILLLFLNESKFLLESIALKSIFTGIALGFGLAPVIKYINELKEENKYTSLDATKNKSIEILEKQKELIISTRKAISLKTKKDFEIEITKLYDLNKIYATIDILESIHSNINTTDLNKNIIKCRDTLNEQIELTKNNLNKNIYILEAVYNRSFNIDILDSTIKLIKESPDKSIDEFILWVKMYLSTIESLNLNNNLVLSFSTVIKSMIEKKIIDLKNTTRGFWVYFFSISSILLIFGSLFYALFKYILSISFTNDYYFYVFSMIIIAQIVPTYIKSLIDSRREIKILELALIEFNEKINLQENTSQSKNQVIAGNWVLNKFENNYIVIAVPKESKIENIEKTIQKDTESNKNIIALYPPKNNVN